MAGGARVVIGADVKEVQPAIDSVVKSVQQGATQVNGSFQGWVGNTNQVATATEKLERQLKGFASEQRTQGRMARFYASELASVIPAAEGAKGALQGLLSIGIEGISGGLGFGVAFESVKFVIEQVSKGFEVAAKQAEQLEKVSIAAAAGIMSASDAFDKLTRNETPGDKAFREVFNAGTKGAKELTEEIEKLRPTTAQQVWAFLWDGSVGIKRLNDQFAEGAAKLGEMTAAAKKAADAIREIAGDDAAMFGPGSDEGLAKFQIASDKAVAAAKERLRVTELIQKAEQTIAAYQAQSYDKGNFPDAFYDGKTWNDMQASKDQAWDPMFGPGNAQGAMEFDDKLKSINQESSQMQELWGSIGGSVGSAFNSIGAAVGGTAGKILGWLGQMITQAIQLAVAMAAASSAWATPLGAVAIGALVAAGLLGLVASVGARADGGPISAMQPYLVGERGPELIVPGQSGTVIPNHALGGATTINIHATDAQSFERMLRRHDNELVRVLRDANRAGRGV